MVGDRFEVASNRLGLGRSLLCALLFGGCARTARPAASQPVEKLAMDPIAIRVSPGGGYEVTDARELFDRATDELDGRNFSAAIADYDELLRLFPDSRLGPAAHYDDGLAHEGEGDSAGAAEHYRAVIAADPAGGEALDARYRLGAVLAAIDEFADSATLFGQILARSDLAPADRIEAFARKGYAEYRAGSLDEAERTLHDGIDYFDSVADLASFGDRFYLAMDRFYLARIPHDRFLAIRVRLPQAQLEEDLSAKATLLLTAQGRYIACINEGSVEWAAAAGYEIGRIYKEFYDAVVAAPIPPELPASMISFYKQEVRKKMAPLLEKAIRVHEKVIEVGEEHGVDNPWVRGSEEQLGLIRHLLAETENGDEPEDAVQVGGAPPASAPSGMSTSAPVLPPPLPPPLPGPLLGQYVPRLPVL